MPWARFDDQFPINRKVNGLTDTEFRLHVEAVIWCARELTDGRVGRDELDLVSRIRSPRKHVAMLVIRKLWHLGDEDCSSTKCPAHVDNRVDPLFDGWLIHDYFEYQFTKKQVLAEREGNAKRQKKWRDQHKHDRNAVTNGVRNGVTNSAPARTRPEGTGRADVDEGVSRRNAHPPARDDAPNATAPAEPAGPKPPHKCPQHHDDPNPPPCGACAETRKARTDWERKKAAAESHRQSEMAHEQAELRRLAIAACRECDTTGYANGVVCDHDPSTPERASRGAAKARDLLSRKGSP